MIRAAKAEDAAQIRAFWNTEIRDTLITFNSVEKTESDLVAMIEEKASAGLGFLVQRSTAISSALQPTASFVVALGTSIPRNIPSCSPPMHAGVGSAGR